MAIQQDITLIIGEDWVIKHTAYEADGVTPSDVTGASYVFTVKDRMGNYVIGPGVASVTPIDAVHGLSAIVVSAAVQSSLTNLKPGPCTYGVQITFASGLVSAMTYGNVTLQKKII